MKNSGKQFELNFENSVDKSYCFLYRIKDSAQSYNNSPNTKYTHENPCDFYLFNSVSHQLFALELKSTQYKSISFQIDENDKSSKMIKYHQIKSLVDISKYDGIIAGLLLNFRDDKNDEQRTYFINIKDFNKMVKETNKTSCNEIDLLLYNAIKIESIKKRVHYRYDIDKFLNDMNEKLN